MGKKQWTNGSIPGNSKWGRRRNEGPEKGSGTKATEEKAGGMDQKK